MRILETKFTEEELEFLNPILQKGELGFGPNVSLFETQFQPFSGKTHNTATNSASAAAFIIFAYLKEKYGVCDVYTPSLAFTSPAWAAKHFGHNLIWVDIDDNLLFDCNDYLNMRTSSSSSKNQTVVMPILYGGVSNINNWKLTGDEIVVVDSAHCVTPTIKSDFTFIGVKESSVEKYEKIKDNLFATVKFVAEVISVKKDSENKVIEGNPDKIKFVTDSWKFTRNIKQKDLNWHLSEIISK